MDKPMAGEGLLGVGGRGASHGGAVGVSVAVGVNGLGQAVGLGGQAVFTR
jgi:hypothetical protein